jgi:SAM-dependent methyltransferase
MFLKNLYIKIRPALIPPRRAVALKKLAKQINRYKCIADLGCGYGSSFYESLSLSKHARGGINYVSVDVFMPALLKGREDGKLVHPVQAVLGSLPIVDKAVELAILVDVIEHFEKKEVELLLSEVDRITKCAVVLTTPNGFMEQEEVEGNAYQLHRSGWSAGDLRALGFKVEGIDAACTFFRGRFGIAGKAPDMVINLVLGLLRIYPAGLSSMLFAVKKIEN